MITNSFDLLIKNISYRSDHLQFISYLLLKYNLRVSEILEVKKENLFYPFMIVFPGKKKSANVIIRDKEVLDYFYKLLPSTNDKFFYFLNYSTIYNYFRKNFSHLFPNYKKNKYNKVTHAPRYFYSQLTNDAYIVRDILHHRSLASGKYYNNKI